MNKMCANYVWWVRHCRVCRVWWKGWTPCSSVYIFPTVRICWYSAKWTRHMRTYYTSCANSTTWRTHSWQLHSKSNSQDRRSLTALHVVPLYAFKCDNIWRNRTIISRTRETKCIVMFDLVGVSSQTPWHVKRSSEACPCGGTSTNTENCLALPWTAAPVLKKEGVPLSGPVAVPRNVMSGPQCRAQFTIFNSHTKRCDLVEIENVLQSIIFLVMLVAGVYVTVTLNNTTIRSTCVTRSCELSLLNCWWVILFGRPMWITHMGVK